MKAELHLHTTYSDGANTPEEMVLAACKAGVQQLGFSDHSFTPFDRSYCMGEGKLPYYVREINALKQKYAGKIDILCGLEQDYYSPEPDLPLDYLIGSVHYIKGGERYFPVDEDPRILLGAANDEFKGDMYALIEEYYRTVGKVLEQTKANYVGHFDLISKFNDNGELFDPLHPRYVAAWQAAADALLAQNAVFEINTGAIARGYKKEPYPAAPIYTYLREKGARFLLSGDAHSVDTICFNFDKYQWMLV